MRPFLDDPDVIVVDYYSLLALDHTMFKKKRMIINYCNWMELEGIKRKEKKKRRREKTGKVESITSFLFVCLFVLQRGRLRNEDG